MSYEFTIRDPKVRCEVFVAGENLTDADDEYAPGYPMPGAGGMVGLRIGL